MEVYKFKNASFNSDAVKKMTKKQFVDAHKGLPYDLEDLYFKITGKKDLKVEIEDKELKPKLQIKTK